MPRLRPTELTGAQFGPDYHSLVADGRFEMDSTAAAIGFAALRTAAPERALESAEVMQRAFYVDGLSLSEASTYRRIAERLGLDADAVVTGFAAPDGRAAAVRDFTHAARLGVTTQLTDAIDQYLPVS